MATINMPQWFLIGILIYFCVRIPLLILSIYFNHQIARLRKKEIKSLENQE